MLSKESKILVLENFYAIDYALFGNPIRKLESCCPLLKEDYVSVKGALLSVYIEMLKLGEHNPKKLIEKVSSKKLFEMARMNAKNARKVVKRLVTTEKARRGIKAELKEALTENKNVNITKLVEMKIREKAFRLAVDNLLVARALQESSNVQALNGWTGKIIEEAYKILRDNLCEIAISILEDDEK